jgi:DNA-binding protein YbaB
MGKENKERLQKAIKDAHGEALKKMQRVVAGKMQEMGGFDGMNLPGLGK